MSPLLPRGPLDDRTLLQRQGLPTSRHERIILPETVVRAHEILGQQRRFLPNSTFNLIDRPDQIIVDLLADYRIMLVLGMLLHKLPHPRRRRDQSTIRASFDQF
ncbi:BZ3500_MvSof-1268-A1-R1_Chr9g10861 [Microbotryum saponariae]|uniref:BZ3500_MvSof-1268-A1-R1_Chr9g10861 protein n=1 Tax=Microbotryum saponariae TaxID=289078 RepID=A0A2X0KC92_9BASI|nr:BZ3501_MvSof-1269-A2-R1_Chr9g10609 [Microbotryum saponariae]SDA00823.1 BZ3500_MvSof-1268-A1-R1_Chr9g10861 [Microbotryum saponariae]